MNVEGLGCRPQAAAKQNPAAMERGLAIILKKIGAQQMAEGEIAAMVGADGGGGSSEDGEQRSRDGRAISFGDGSAALTRQVATAYDDAGALARNETV